MIREFATKRRQGFRRSSGGKSLTLRQMQCLHGRISERILGLGQDGKLAMAQRHVLAVAAICAGLLVGTAAFAGPATTMDVTEQAMQDAREKLKREILSTEIGQGQTIGSVLKDRGLVDELDRQLGEAKPVGGPRWLDERNCQVRVELPGERVMEILGKASVQQPGSSAAQTIGRRTFVSVGSSCQTERPARAEGERKLVPQQPPEWVNRTISAEAWSRTASSPLMTAQAAEADARRILSQRVGALVLAVFDHDAPGGRDRPGHCSGHRPGSEYGAREAH